MIRKTVTTPTGYDVNVWKITKLTIDAINYTMAVVISGFKDESASKTPDAELLSRQYIFSFADFSSDDTANVMAGVQSVYEKIATLPDFSDN